MALIENSEDANIQRKLIKVLIDLLNVNHVETKMFQEGYLLFQEIESVSRTQIFSFISKDPTNNFGIKENKYIPTSFGAFIGKIQPSQDVYDETGTLNIEFAVPINGDFLERLTDIEEFKRSVRQKTGTFTVKRVLLGEFSGTYPTPSQLPPSANNDIGTYAYVEDFGWVYEVVKLASGATQWRGTLETLEEYETEILTYNLNTAPINQETAPILLNGVNVVQMNITVYYRVFDSLSSNVNEYFIEPLNADSNRPKIKIPEIGRSGGIAASLNPQQKNSSNQVGSTVGAVSWSKNCSMYDSIRVLDAIAGVPIKNNWFATELEEAYRKGSSKLNTVYKLSISTNRTRELETPEEPVPVLIESITYNDPTGTAITFAFVFRVADDLIIQDQLIEPE